MTTCLDDTVIPEPSGYRVPVGGRGRILIPASIERVAGGLWIGAACTTPGLAFDWLLGVSTRISTRLGSGRPSVTALPDIDWVQWTADSVSAEGITDGAVFIVVLPRDIRRRRFQLAIADESGRVRAFSKFTLNPPSPLAKEVRSRLRERRFKTFDTPTPMSEGEVAGWHFSVDEALVNGFHRPATLHPLEMQKLVNEYQDAFADLVPSPHRLVHGDFGPWNVRVTSNNRVLVFDWEEVTVGPKATDELWNSLNALLLRFGSKHGLSESIRRALPHHDERAVAEAASFWLEHLSGPEPAEVEGQVVTGRGLRLVDRQRQVLEALAGSTLTR